MTGCGATLAAGRLSRPPARRGRPGGTRGSGWSPTRPSDELAARNWPAPRWPRPRCNAVLNRWGDGPDTPAGVRARLRRPRPGAAELAERLVR